LGEQIQELREEMGYQFSEVHRHLDEILEVMNKNNETVMPLSSN